ncbi:MotA/TolQ/ExbB proton channel family protein [Rubellicoccus peritrichatus]|uniref:MotA/TolQ/ExbB proton channel family protein n=1 Tax=Rubellicoccus peritrichatus TaxID=3080537 RepID=A0AAQ3QX77_9BACT|nr:MotA/TolQ/ExbB proton channel family protein [Puniceicoccus sp. CR14]WOO42737.1 MotA/TolQ/ExbB proton channel family protein [Puniceicoccus sp. CR14]
MNNQTFWEFSADILQSGGLLMIPLYFLAALVFANCLQLYFYMSKQNLPKASGEELTKYIREPEKAPYTYSKILRYVTDSDWTEDIINTRFNEVHLAVLSIVDRRIRYLQTLVASAPLMGLLGTVIGMLATFVGLANSGGETVDVVAGGIKEALITTQTGLMIALPGLFVVLIVQRRKHKLEAAMAKLRSMTLATLTTQ